MLRTNLLSIFATVFVFSVDPALAEQGDLTVVFQDSFDRNVSGEDAKTLGNEWKLNTHEEHQFALKEGACHVTRNTDAKHFANLLHKAEFRNGSLALRFKVDDESDLFRIQVRDSAVKEVKQGMLFNVRLGDGKLELDDAVVVYHIKQAMKSAKTEKPSPEQRQELDKVTVNVPVEINVGQWHELMVDVHENKLTVLIDGQEKASLTSGAIGHPTKDNFRIEVGRALVLDDIKVSATGT